MTFAATVLTLYPEMFPGPLGISLAGRALERGDWSLETVQIRDFAKDKHRTVDDTPAGGGAGMVLKADVLAAAVDSVTDAEADAYFHSRPKASQIGAWASQQSRPLKGRFELEGRVAQFTAKYAIGQVPLFALALDRGEGVAGTAAIGLLKTALAVHNGRSAA